MERKMRNYKDNYAGYGNGWGLGGLYAEYAEGDGTGKGDGNADGWGNGEGIGDVDVMQATARCGGIADGGGCGDGFWSDEEFGVMK